MMQNVGATLDPVLLATQLIMMGVAVGTLVYLGAKAVRHKRSSGNVATIDVFVGATVVFDLMMLVSWWCSNYLVVNALECEVDFVFTYVGGIGGELVMCCFAHFSHLIIAASTCDRHRRAGTILNPSYAVYVVICLTCLVGLTLCVLMGDMGDFTGDSQDMCWFIVDAHNYAIWWFELPRILLSIVTLVYLSLGFRLIMKQRGVTGGKQTNAYIWRYVLYSFPTPLVRIIPTAANAALDILMVETGSTDYESQWSRVLFMLSTTPALLTVLAYAVPHWYFAHKERPAPRKERFRYQSVPYADTENWA
ncbi:hypothetical protein KIPB_004753 [Kipferlia bialata]|uniref:Uncharacterized protein n=1 Tax=Kipferlia bialata TaxID=797122 RepID=A0A9K3CXG3_9EUKA|nr:hypothetical protein KIPB_004753 [Kipferlia bialata]|eukprot:g4753.t1